VLAMELVVEPVEVLVGQLVVMLARVLVER
jgi:hypothetical protein